MKPKFRELRLKQLAESLTSFESARAVVRPRRGWLRAIREATGMSLRQLGRAMKATPQSVASLEKSEERSRITLQSLETAAEAMGCQLVYAIIPKSGTILDLADGRTRHVAEQHVRAVEHTMLLENQAVGRVEEKISQETRRLLKGA
jgi:predicted DNA-binding mobile mystery protein A